MSEPKLKLRNAPIVEAVLDIDCDMPPSFDLKKLEASAREKLCKPYPKLRTVMVHEHELKAQSDSPPEASVLRYGVEAFQFIQDDEKQLVQIRRQGFSFNRLTPYESLDDYLQEIERTWRIFFELASPVQIRIVRLRYINRFLLPLKDGSVELDDYLKIAPHLPDEKQLGFAGFLNQHTAIELNSGNEVRIILASQDPEPEVVPIVLDITAASAKKLAPGNWPDILATIQSLRELKNRVFKDSLTDKCLRLFQ